MMRTLNVPRTLGQCRHIRLQSSSYPFPFTRYYATSANTQSDPNKKYSNTLLLPKTDFPVRHKVPVEVERRLRSRTADELYRSQGKKNGKPFVLLDGPPYANGNLHMGHALNKVLKDIINRYKVLRGYRVHYSPGWDCHGLPIEHKALAAIEKSHLDISPIQVRKIARETAVDAIATQKQEMRDLGVMADWDAEEQTYRTMDRKYEIRQLKLLNSMMKQGLITHRLRPTYYSPVSRTALAEAELSYKDGHRSNSVYVGFKVDPADMSAGLKSAYSQACKGVGEKKLLLPIWTTTPWTLPSNMGVNVHNDLPYVLALDSSDRLLVVSEERLTDLKELFGDLRVLSNLKGSDICGTTYSHYFSKTQNNDLFQVFHSDHVRTESGTGLVHTAPAHGHDDYHAFGLAGIMPEKLRCPLDDAGNFTADLLPWAQSEDAKYLVGKSVLGDGNRAVISLMKRNGDVIAEQDITHRYPYDWKSKTPVIVRATPQWFADVEGIKSRAKQALDSVHFYPTQSRQRLESFVNDRSEWCISRQRSWGVPIPVLFNTKNEPVIEDDILTHVLEVLEREGIDHWWSGPMEDFVPESHKGQELSRGGDTLDVWFDSGSAWTSIEDNPSQDASTPVADVCLEGSDQHRGWFQSLLLTKIGRDSDNPTPPYKHLITHGFIVDEDGSKMSKSAGNGVSPAEFINGKDGAPGHGADHLRVWVASVDYQKDVSFGAEAVTQAAGILRKLRNVSRFMLAVTADVDKSQVTKAPKSTLDSYVLHRLSEVEEAVAEAYDSFAFPRVVHTLSTFVNGTVSNLYIDGVREILYNDPVNSPRRLAIVTTLKETFESMTRMMAPITPYLAEELNESMTKSETSVFEQQWHPQARTLDATIVDDIERIMALRADVLKMVEVAREAKQLRQSPEADLYITASETTLAALQRQAEHLPRLFSVAAVRLDSPPTATWSQQVDSQTAEGTIGLTIVPAEGTKCARCWQFHAKEQDELCRRCADCLA